MDINKISINKELKIVFMGTPDFAVPVLEALIKDYNVRAIVTQPDKLVGRDQHLSYSPVKKVGMEHTMLVLQPVKIRTDFQEVINLEPDLIITCAYGQIIPKEILDCPRLGCINVHASLLPKLRGGAPIQHAIMDGYKETGVTIMYMNEKMDDGDIIAQEKITIGDEETADSLYERLKVLGKDLLMKTLPSIIDGTNSRTKQNPDEVTYAFNIKREDEKLDFSKNKYQLHNQIRGLNSFPGSYCLLDGIELKVWEAYISDNFFPEKIDGEITAIYNDGFGVKVSNGELIFKTVQLAGKNKVNGADFARGMMNHRKFIGEILA
jgi:methionyl-tRNA formyltransferase